MNRISCFSSLVFVFFLLLGLSLNNHSAAQIIATIAGNGTSGYTGDGGPAISAMLSTPNSITFDASGSIYFADSRNNCIRKINPSGLISTIAGTGTLGFSGDGGPATSAKLNFPWGVAVDGTGNIYIADSYNNRIRKVSSTGIISTVAGNGIAGYSGDGGPATAAEFNRPNIIAVDNSGNIIIPDELNNAVRKVSPAGIISTIAGTGVPGYTGDGGPATLAQLDYPTGVAVDCRGNIYFADDLNNVIRKINTAGIISTIAGTGLAGFSGDGAAATTARMNGPTSVAIDYIGNIYITDENNFRIRKVTPSGIISTISGNGIAGFNGDGPAITAELNFPYGIAVLNDSGCLFIGDQENNRVRIIRNAFTPGTSISPITGLSSLCVGATITLSDLTTGGSWLSSASPIASVDTSSGVVTGISSGTVVISYTVAGGCSSIKDITVNPLPHAGTISGLDSLCPGKSVPLFDTSSGGTWVSKHTSVAIINGEGVVTGITPGSDSVWYIVTNTCGADTAIFRIGVRSEILCAEGINQIINPQPSAIALFPNPSHGSFTLNLSAPEDVPALITITNVLGQKVKEWTVSTNKETIFHLSEPPGIYFVTARINNECLYLKVVLE